MVETDEERAVFIDEYAAYRPFRPGATERLELYALSDWMVIWEYGKRHGQWFGEESFVESVQPILANVRKITS